MHFDLAVDICADCSTARWYVTDVDAARAWLELERIKQAELEHQKRSAQAAGSLTVANDDAAGRLAVPAPAGRLSEPEE